MAMDLSYELRVMFFSRNILHTKFGQEDEPCDLHLNVVFVLPHCCISCELQLSGPEYEPDQRFSFILEPFLKKSFSSHISLLQIQCYDQKDLFFFPNIQV